MAGTPTQAQVEPPQAQDEPPARTGKSGEDHPPADDPPLPQNRGQWQALFAQLDADAYEEREAARQKVAQALSAANAEAQLTAAVVVQELLIAAGTSFELRKELEQLAAQLPAVELMPEVSASPEELRQVVQDLDSPQYAARVAAEARVDWLVRRPEHLAPLLQELDARLADATQSGHDRKWLQEIYERVWHAYLLQPEDSVTLPPISAEAIARLLHDLTAPPEAFPNAHAAKIAAQTSLRRLNQLLAWDQHAPAIKQQLEARLAQQEHPALQELQDRWRESLVAEVWSSGQNVTVQLLWVGVPQLPQLADRPVRATHFDRVDETTAHCVSGNSLEPGDYQLDTVIPHPDITIQNVFFRLHNTVTPSRKLRYEAWLSQPEPVRLAKITRQFLEGVLASGREFTDEELGVLAQLQPEGVSAFAGEYLLKHDDAPCPSSIHFVPFGECSRHATIAWILAQHGTPAALPGLRRAADQQRFLPPTEDCVVHMEWLAQLMIAQRYPQAVPDAFLAELLTNAALLTPENAGRSEVAATAAAQLLTRHKKLPEAFGIQEVVEQPRFNPFGITFYRFGASDSQQQVLNWWQTEGTADK